MRGAVDGRCVAFRGPGGRCGESVAVLEWEARGRGEAHDAHRGNGILERSLPPFEGQDRSVPIEARSFLKTLDKYSTAGVIE